MTVTPLGTTPAPLDPGLCDLPTWDRPAAPPTWGQRLHRLLGVREIGILTFVALLGYLASAYWVRYGLHFWINDALNRTDDALYVTVGRDPHLGAIGFYWPPLPQLVQLPLMPFLRPFGAEIMAGPISSAICAAATIPILGQIGKRLGLHRWLTFGICASFAINPDIIYTASNGMSEACFLLAGAVTMLGFLSYIQTRTTADLLIFTLGLSAAIMTRLEGPFLVFALVVVATFSLRHLRASLWHFAIIAAPPYGLFALWIVVQWILLKDPLFFLHQLSPGGNPAPGTAAWLPNTAHDPLAVVPWALGWIIVLGPVLLLLAASLIVRPLAGRNRGTLGILGGIGVFLAIQMYQVATGTGFGDPRYFVMAILFATVGALWLASNRGGSFILGTWNLALITTLVVSGGTASYALTSGRITHVEAECSYFQYGVAQAVPFLGRSQTGRYACIRPGDGLGPWQAADRWIDGHLTAKDRILADNASDYAACLFSTRPKLFIVRNDRDWAKTVADPRDVTYIMTQSLSANAPPTEGATYGADEGAALIGLDRQGWHLVKTFKGALNVLHNATVVQLWHFVPGPRAGATPTGTESEVR